MAGCAAPPQLDKSTVERIYSSVPIEEGRASFTSIAIWIPNSREFIFRSVEPKVKGVLVLAENALLFQQWGGRNGLTTIKRVPLSDISSAKLINFGLSSRIVIETKSGEVDSFAASDGDGEVSIQPETINMHNALLALRPDLKE